MPIQPAARRVLAALIFSLPVLLAGPVAVSRLAAQDRGPVNRTVQGVVQDKAGAPVKGAVVYLKDTRTSAIKSAVVEPDGTYRFVQLSQGTDYELWAKLNEKRGPSKTISSFDTKPSLVINLKVD